VTSPIRIVYAEDNAHDVDLTRAHFSEHAPDFDLQVVATGKACLEAVARDRPDLVLLDHHLPDTEGLDVLRALARADEPVPVVLVTGVGDEELVVRALHLGAAYYVSKSAAYLRDLPELLRGVLAEHRVERTRSRAAEGPWRVLYVEHVAMDIELTQRHFADAAPRFELEVARSAAEALERLERLPACDAALIDLRMPGQSGLDLVREAKRRGLPLPPFVVISGKGDEAAAMATL
jgi:CheY-like chemotaxis protein